MKAKSPKISCSETNFDANESTNPFQNIEINDNSKFNENESS